MLKLGKVGKDDLLYDLGSGDGRIVITAAKTYGTRGIGIDINPERINEANENARKAGVGLTQKLSNCNPNSFIHTKMMVRDIKPCV